MITKLESLLNLPIASVKLSFLFSNKSQNIGNIGVSFFLGEGILSKVINYYYARTLMLLKSYSSNNGNNLKLYCVYPSLTNPYLIYPLNGNVPEYVRIYILPKKMGYKGVIDTFFYKTFGFNMAISGFIIVRSDG
jgi:hypothetical protein